MADIGRYRRRVSLIANTKGKDSYGRWYTNPVTQIDCWAYREKIRSLAGYVQQANSYEENYRYEIYYNSGVVIDSDMVLKDSGEEYKITSIEIAGDKKVKWILTCQRKKG